MAGFIAKQLIGNQLDSVKGVLGDKKEEGDGGGGGAGAMDPEVEAALREAEERREARHRRMEEEREVMRQEIRDKYGIKKKEEEPSEFDFASADGRLGRKRKTPAELAAEQDAAEEADLSITNMLPENVRNVASKVTEVPTKIISEASEKCSTM